jgi:hypothetical protein
VKLSQTDIPQVQDDSKPEEQRLPVAPKRKLITYCARTRGDPLKIPLKALVRLINSSEGPTGPIILGNFVEFTIRSSPQWQST